MFSKTGRVPHSVTAERHVSYVEDVDDIFPKPPFSSWKKKKKKKNGSKNPRGCVILRVSTPPPLVSEKIASKKYPRVSSCVTLKSTPLVLGKIGSKKCPGGCTISPGGCIISHELSANKVRKHILRSTYYDKTHELPNPRPTQPKKKLGWKWHFGPLFLESGILGHFFPQQSTFRGLRSVLYRKKTTRKLAQPILRKHPNSTPTVFEIIGYENYHRGCTIC